MQTGKDCIPFVPFLKCDLNPPLEVKENVFNFKKREGVINGNDSSFANDFFKTD
jgi:hypothetical protein